MWDDGNGLTFLEAEKQAKRMYRSGKITYKQYMVIHHRNIKHMEHLKENLVKKVNELEKEKAAKKAANQDVSDIPM